MAESREELLKQAKAKLERDELLAQAKAKLDAENGQTSDGSGVLDQIETGSRGLLSGMSAGLSEPVISGANALVGKAINALPIGPSSEELGGATVVEANPSLGQLFDEDVARRRELKAANPGSDIVGELAGSLSPVGPAASAFRGAQSLAKAAPILGKLGTVGKIAQEGLGAGLYGLGQGVARKGALETTGFVAPGEEKGVIEQGLNAAKIGAAIPGGIAGLKALGAGAKIAGKALLGVKEQTMARFAARAEQVMNAKSREEIVEQAQAAARDLRNAATSAKEDLTDDVALGLATLKQQILDASDVAYQALENSSNTVPLSAVKNAIKAASANLEKPGFVGSAVTDAKQKVNNFVNSLEGLPEDLDGPTLKRIVKSLDDDLTFLSAGEFAGSRTQSTMLQARGNVDNLLKGNFEQYAKDIKPVRDLAQFHDEVYNNLKTPQKVFSSLSRFGKPGNEIKDKQLKRFFEQTNINPDRFRQAQEESKLFDNWDKFSTVESKVKGMMTGNSDALKQQFQQLSDLSGTDFVQTIEDLATKTQFEQEFLRGSRNVNLWTIIGGAGGTAVGGGIPGAIIGAAAGAMIDKYGPKIAQKTIGAYTKIKGIPTIKKIEEAFDGLPPEVIQEAKSSFIRTVVDSKRDTEPTLIPEANRLDIGKEIQTSQYLTPTEKAKMLTQLVKEGRVSGFSKLLAPEQKKPVPAPILPESTRKPEMPNRVQGISDFVKSKRKEEF